MMVVEAKLLSPGRRHSVQNRVVSDVFGDGGMRALTKPLVVVIHDDDPVSHQKNYRV